VSVYSFIIDTFGYEITEDDILSIISHGDLPCYTWASRIREQKDVVNVQSLIRRAEKAFQKSSDDLAFYIVGECYLECEEEYRKWIRQNMELVDRLFSLRYSRTIVYMVRESFIKLEPKHFKVAARQGMF
jgi:hypothetical protein